MSDELKKRVEPTRGDRYENRDGVQAELCVPLQADEGNSDVARFGYSAFLYVDGQKVARLNRPYVMGGPIVS